jgi:hypothetical protein
VNGHEGYSANNLGNLGEGRSSALNQHGVVEQIRFAEAKNKTIKFI